MKRFLIMAIGVAAFLGAIALPASAAVKRIDSCHARGDFATCVASGNVRHPHRIFVKVRSRPRQRISAYWDDVCSQGSGAGSKSGHFRGTTPIRRRIAMSYRRPSSCTVSADAQLSRHGSLKVILLARV